MFLKMRILADFRRTNGRLRRFFKESDYFINEPPAKSKCHIPSLRFPRAWSSCAAPHPLTPGSPWANGAATPFPPRRANPHRHRRERRWPHPETCRHAPTPPRIAQMPYAEPAKMSYSPLLHFCHRSFIRVNGELRTESQYLAALGRLSRSFGSVRSVAACPMARSMRRDRVFLLVDVDMDLG